MGAINLNKKRILVTGAGGYIGRFLVPELQRTGAQVFATDVKPVDTVPGAIALDITDTSAVKTMIAEIKPDLVFHLAAVLDRRRSFERYEEIKNVNLHGTENLLFALRKVNCGHFIFTSTSEVYGDNEPPFREDQVPSPASPYSLTKLYAENLIATFGKVHGQPYTLLRLFNFYGEHMPENFFIPQLIARLRKNEDFEMTGGEQKRDFLYIKDVIGALLLVAHDVPGNTVYNVCSGKEISLKELALIAKQKTGSSSNLRLGAIPYRDNEIWNMVGDNTKIKRELGFEPQYDLHSGLDRMLGAGTFK